MGLWSRRTTAEPSWRSHSFSGISERSSQACPWHLERRGCSFTSSFFHFIFHLIFHLLFPHRVCRGSCKPDAACCAQPQNWFPFWGKTASVKLHFKASKAVWACTGEGLSVGKHRLKASRNSAARKGKIKRHGCSFRNFSTGCLSCSCPFSPEKPKATLALQSQFWSCYHHYPNFLLSTQIPVGRG